MEKRKPGRPPWPGHEKRIRFEMTLPPALIRRLDDFIEKRPGGATVRVTRVAVVEQAIRELLERAGWLKEDPRG